jgi:hypothetical protein
MFEIAAWTAAACIAAQVHFAPSRTPAAPGVPWVRAGPIEGYLFYYSTFGSSPPPRAVIYTDGETPTGRTKILWYARRGALWMTVRGTRLDAPGSFVERLRMAQNYFYPSIIEIPEAGCWRFTVSSGRRRGRFAFIAIDQ